MAFIVTVNYLKCQRQPRQRRFNSFFIKKAVAHVLEASSLSNIFNISLL